MPRMFQLFFVGLLALLFANTCLYIVDQRQYAIVFGLGQIKDVRSEPGLYFKLPAPFQTVTLLDNRIQTIDTPDAETFFTSDKTSLLVDSYVKWRIIDPKLYFVRVNGSARAAAARLGPVIKGALNEEITKRTVAQIISSERTQVMNDILTKVRKDAQEIGVEIVDVRLKRVDFVPEVSENTYRRMESERRTVANDKRATGAAEAEQIRANADREREIILAEAYKQAQTIKGEGDGKAASIYNSAFGRNPEFFSFYRSLESYRKSMGNKGDVMVLDPKSDYFKYLQKSQGN